MLEITKVEFSFSQKRKWRRHRTEEEEFFFLSFSRRRLDNERAALRETVGADASRSAQSVPTTRREKKETSNSTLMDSIKFPAGKTERASGSRWIETTKKEVFHNLPVIDQHI